MTIVEHAQALLRNASNLSAIARDAGCNIRTIYRIKNGDIKDPGSSLCSRVISAAAQHQKITEPAA